ncbi:hypothetical protein [Streptomyces hilarionis]|nr:hypothetical protein [Streptomyces hilarionis]
MTGQTEIARARASDVPSGAVPVIDDAGRRWPGGRSGAKGEEQA